MQGPDKLFSILDLFIDRAFEWRFDEIREELGMPRSTLYRYLKQLTEAGYLTALPELGYALGPKIIELDYQIRRSDPLIRVAEPAMQELAGRFGGIALLCRLFLDKVLCVHQVSSTDAFSSNYERGRARPLLRGAASLVILADLPSPAMRRLYRRNPESFAEAGLGDSFEAVQSRLRAISERGWLSTSGEVKTGVTGVAAPLFDVRGCIVGSLSVTVPQPHLPPTQQGRIAEQLVFAASIVSNALTRANAQRTDGLQLRRV